MAALQARMMTQAAAEIPLVRRSTQNLVMDVKSVIVKYLKQASYRKEFSAENNKIVEFYVEPGAF